jgi:hypothetical protein
MTLPLHAGREHAHAPAARIASAMSPTRSSAASSQDCGSDRAARGDRTRRLGDAEPRPKLRRPSIRGDAGARGRDQIDSQRMALVARRGLGRAGERRCFCPGAVARRRRRGCCSRACNIRAPISTGRVELGRGALAGVVLAIRAKRDRRPVVREAASRHRSRCGLVGDRMRGKALAR